MGQSLSARDIAGAIATLTGAIQDLAKETGVTARRAQLSDTEALEVERITLSHGSMFRPAPAQLETSGSYEDECLRLTSVAPELFYSSSARSRSATARSRRDAQTLALSRSTAEPVPGQLISKYGLPVTYGGQPVLDTAANRAAFARVLPPMVVDVTDSGSQDISSMVGRATPNLGGDPEEDAADSRVPDARPTPQQIQAVLDQMRADGAWDTGQDLPGVSEFGVEYDQPGASDASSSNPWRRGDVASEVARLQAVHGSAISGLRPGAKRATDGNGKFSSRQARLTGVLSGV